MTKDELIAVINTLIVPNGTEAITGSVLNSVLLDMVNQINDLVGDEASLTAPSVIEEIIDFTSSYSPSILVTQSPTAPSNPNVGDEWIETSGGFPIALYFWDGEKWLTYQEKGSQTEIRTVPASAIIALSDSTIIYTGSGGDTMTLPLEIDASKRIFTIVNLGSSSIVTSLFYLSKFKTSINSIAGNTILRIQSNGITYYEI